MVVSGQRSVVSRWPMATQVACVAQALALALALALANGHATRMATLREWPRYANGHATRMATLCERPWELANKLIADR